MLKLQTYLDGQNVTDSDLFAIHPVDFRWVAIHPDYNLIFFTVGSDSTLMCYDMDRRQVKVICNHDGYPRVLYVPLYVFLLGFGSSFLG